MSDIIWKPVRGQPPYEISNLGEVRNPKTGNLISLNKRGRVGMRKDIPLSTLMRENHPWEWIKELEEGEEVKPLEEHPGYFITSLGRVWSMKHYKFLSPSNTTGYYWFVGMRGKGNSYRYYNIHSLVGRAFIPEYREGLHILHKKETLPYPQINYVENLWVGTQADNNRDRDSKGRVTKRRGKYCKVEE